MQAEYASRVAQQLYDVRPSPTLEVNKQLYPTPSPSPALDAVTGTAPPGKPFAPRPVSYDGSTTITGGFYNTSTPIKRQPPPVVVTSSPKGTNDIFSMATDRQLAEKYKFVEEIGFGNWGSVWKVHTKQGEYANQTQAVKLVFRTKEDKTTPARVRSIWQEFKIIRAFKADPHPNIIQFYDFIICPSYALVVMDIHSKLMPTNLPETVARPYFQQLLSGLDYLHVHGVTHNDIKPANILISSDDRPIIVDFGFANRWSLESKHQDTAFMSALSWGTPEYLAPERAAQKMHDERLSDIWSLGITMYEIVIGRTPFEKDTTEEFLSKEALEVYYNRTLAGTFHGSYKLSLAFEDLLRQMVEPSTANRLVSCGKGLLHPFFSLRPPSVMLSEARSVSAMFTKVNAVPSVPFTYSSSTATTPQKADAQPALSSSTKGKHQLESPRPALSPVQSPAQPRAPAPTPVTSPMSSYTRPKSVQATRKAVLSATSADKSPAKRRGEVKVFKDPKSPIGNANSNNASGKAGLRPLILRAGSASSVKPINTSKEIAPPVPASSNTSTILGASSPSKVFGNLISANSNHANNGLNRSVSGKSPTGTPKKQLAASRDSKELRSPVSVKAGKSLDEKENFFGSLKRARSNTVSTLNTVKGSPAKLGRSPSKKLNDSSLNQSSRNSSESRPLPAQSTAPVAAPTEPRPVSKLSKRRPSESKLNKSTSSISFGSLSSSFRSKSRLSGDRLRDFDTGRPVQDDYAMVERDTRLSSDGSSGLAYLREDVIHIRNPSEEKQEIIQERIISPQAQREYGQAVEQETLRSSFARSNSSSSNKRLPLTPPSEVSPPPVPVLSPKNKIRVSLAPSFAARSASAASDRSEDRCDSRQSDVSDSSVESGQSHDGDATINHSESVQSHIINYVPSITVSTSGSVASSRQFRSCWSPETVPSEATSESEFGERPESQQSNHTYRRDNEEEEEETMHATPQFRRTSAVFTRSPRAESIYQSFICPSPQIEIPAAARLSPAPRTTSLNATWGPSSRGVMTPSPEAQREYRDLQKLNTSEYTLFPPPEDLRSLASPPPRPDTAASKRTLTKMKSWLGKLGFGSRH